MQRDIVVVILYGSISNQYKIVKRKIANIINYQYWEQFRIRLYIVGGCMVACRGRNMLSPCQINIHNTSCVLTCEFLILICIHRTQRG
jgi:hypothetical protein